MVVLATCYFSLSFIYLFPNIHPPLLSLQKSFQRGVWLVHLDLAFISHAFDTINLICRCTYLYDTLRPKLIHETNLDFLCELIDILKVEVLGEQISRRGESLAGLRPTLHRILADVHERLTFRARTHIRDEVGIPLQMHFAALSLAFMYAGCSLLLLLLLFSMFGLVNLACSFELYLMRNWIFVFYFVGNGMLSS